MPFPFENLNAYQQSLKVVSLAQDVCSRNKDKSLLRLFDQFTRAAWSIPLNIAEGNGRWHKPDKKQFFWVARGSAFECVPIIQILKERGVLDQPTYAHCYFLLEEISKMLSGLIKSVDLEKT